MKILKAVWNLFIDIKNPKGFEIARLKKRKRYSPTITNAFGFPFKIVDGPSFAWQYIEIFRREVYKFQSNEPSPYILDCGANVGTSILYFKHLYKNAEIVAFEPDPVVFQSLNENLKNAGLSNVQLINKAVWSKDGFRNFDSEGADGGRLLTGNDKNTESTKVPTIRLRTFLNRQVDFLKIDIEGAETEVLSDCEDLLVHVKNLFVEYHSPVSGEQKIHVLLAVLYRAGFKVNLESVTLENKNPFLQRSILNGFDNLVNIYAWR